MHELQETSAYKDFMQLYPDACLTSGFFILNKNEKEGDSLQLDFFLPSEKKMASFEYPFREVKVHDDNIENRQEITNLNFTIDIPDLEAKVTEVTGKDYAKIIAILEKDVWNLTCLSGMDLKRLKIDVHTGEASGNEDVKLTDIIKIQKGNRQDSSME